MKDLINILPESIELKFTVARIEHDYSKEITCELKQGDKTGIGKGYHYDHGDGDIYPFFKEALTYAIQSLLDQ